MGNDSSDAKAGDATDQGASSDTVGSSEKGGESTDASTAKSDRVMKLSHSSHTEMSRIPSLRRKASPNSDMNSAGDSFGQRGSPSNDVVPKDLNQLEKYS